MAPPLDALIPDLASHDPDQPRYNEPMMQDPELIWKQRQRQWLDEHRDHLPSRRKGMGVRFILSLVLFATTWTMFQIDTEWSRKGQQYVTSVFSQSYHFEDIAVWYNKVFQGAPSFLPAFEQNNKLDPSTKASGSLKQFATPVSGVIITPFEEHRNGIMLSTREASEVKVISTGRVIHVGQREDIGLTVIVQHADLYISVYGMLSETWVHPNDWLEHGESVGRVQTGAQGGQGQLFFSLSHNNEYINPADVVKFD